MQLTVDWKIKTLGEIAEVQSGGTPLKSRNEYWFGDIPWYSSGELNETFTKAPKEMITSKGLEESNAKLFPKGSLLIGMYDTAALKMSILDRDAAFNQAIAGVKPNEKIDLKFILYAVNSRKFEILNQRRGVRQKNLSLAKIKNIALPIPPLPEQKRIVAILDEAFEGIDRAIANTEKNLANSRELFESYLNTIFTQKGDGWVEKKLGNLLDTLTDYHANGSYEILKRNVSLLDNDGYAYMVRSTDFENNFTNNLKYIDKHAYEFLSKSKVFGGEIIISKIGNAGKVYLMPSIDRPCYLAMNLFLLRTNVDQIRSDYLYFFLESRFGKVQISERLNGTTTKTTRKDGIRTL